MWESAKMSYCTLHVTMQHGALTKGRHLAVVSHAPEHPMGVSNIVKMESSPPPPPMIHTPTGWFVFLTNISDLLYLSQDKLEFCGSSFSSE